MKKLIQQLREAMIGAKYPADVIVARLLEDGHITLDEACVLLVREISIKIESIDNHCGVVCGGDGSMPADIFASK